MISLISHIDVPASPARVWQVLTNFAGYREWHPFVELEGEAVEGAKITFTHRNARGIRQARAEAELTRVTPAEHLALEIGLPRFGSIKEWYALEAVAGGTRLTHGVEFGGMLSFFARFIRKRLDGYFRAPIISLARRFAKPSASIATPAKPVRKGGLRPPNRRRHRR